MIRGTGSVHSSFEVIPAIDIRGGRVVRLEEGDFGRETTYGDDPAGEARRWITAGARLLHVVDLDGARDGSLAQLPALSRVVRAARDLGASCEVAGGLRDADAVAAARGIGAARVVIGTAAVRDPALVGMLVARHGAERIVVALDVRNGMAVGEGWRAGTQGRAVTGVVRDLMAVGVSIFVVTSIARDGLLGGPDLELLGEVLEAADGAAVIASGGISSAGDLCAVRAAGCVGAIIGRALYEGTLTVEAALAAATSGR
jgi:phosphoribosylformimino-5-aminoimidazole carboxamide ribotide isomerase